MKDFLQICWQGRGTTKDGEAKGLATRGNPVAAPKPEEVRGEQALEGSVIAEFSRIAVGRSPDRRCGLWELQAAESQQGGD